MFVLKIICLFLGILLTYVNTVNSMGRRAVSGLKVLVQIVAVTGFIILQWLI